MKLWVIYSRGSENGFIPPQVFAFTNKPKLFEMFKQQRNMKCYVVRVYDSKDVGKESLFREMDKFYGKALIASKLKTKPNADSNGIVNVALTQEEEFEIVRRSGELIPNYLMDYDMLDVEVLSNESLKLLEAIHFFDVVRYLGIKDCPFWDGLAMYNWEPVPDELAIFADIIADEEDGHILELDKLMRM